MLRIVVAKPGLDGHDRGAKVVARALRDAGHEVIYTGLHQTPEQIVETAIQEDADLIGLSVLSGAHMTLFRKLIALLEERDASDIVVFGGGIVPDEDVAPLEEIGVAKIFTPGATTGEITGWVKERFAESTRPVGQPWRRTNEASRSANSAGRARGSQWPSSTSTRVRSRQRASSPDNVPGPSAESLVATTSSTGSDVRHGTGRRNRGTTLAR